MPGVFDLRKKFYVNIETILEMNHFFRVFWAGDGGLFAREYKNYEDAECVCLIADLVFAEFERLFKKRNTSLSPNVCNRNQRSNC